MMLISFSYPDNSGAKEKQVQSATIHDAAAGFSLEIPDGWVYQVGAEAIMVGHNTMPGFILISPVSANNVDELSNEIQVSLMQAGNGLSLYPESIQARDERTVEVIVQGQSGFQLIRGYSLNIISLWGGGLSIIALVTAELFSDAYPALVEQIAGSVQFFEPEQAKEVQYWQNRLAGNRLTYSSSHYDTSGGWSERSEFHLCPDGSVHGSSSSGVSVDRGGAFGGSHGGSGQMQGQWRIKSFSGHAAIQAKFNDGTIYRLPLSEQNGNIYLGGQRWFVTKDAQCM